MTSESFTNYIDVAQVTLYAFWIFFAGLVFYLHREDKREGYPLVSEVLGHTEEIAAEGLPPTPPPKVFRLFHGGVALSPPASEQLRFPRGARPAATFPGAPLEPTGNPLIDGLGPASWAEREDEPDLTIDGKVKIKPMSEEGDYRLHPSSPDPRSWAVVGADGLTAGVVVDIWIDEIEEAVRYLELVLTLPGLEGQHVLVPQPFARFRPRRRQVSVRSILAEQFADIPRLRRPDQVTRLEEDRLVGYFGGGALYATANRRGPLL